MLYPRIYKIKQTTRNEELRYYFIIDIRLKLAVNYIVIKLIRPVDTANARETIQSIVVEYEFLK